MMHCEANVDVIPHPRGGHSAMDDRKHVIVIDEELPYPLNTGKRIRTYNLITRLASRFRIGFLCHRNAGATEFEEARTHFESLGIEGHVIPRQLPNQSVLSSGLAYYGGLAKNLLSPRPYLVDKHDSPELRDAIKKLDQLHTVDLWHCEWTPYAAPFLDSTSGPWVIDAHNVESQIWARYAEHEKQPFKRWYIRHQFRKFLQFEHQAFHQSDAAIVVSDSDAAVASDWFGDAKSTVVENGVDLDYFVPGQLERNKQELLFLGSLDWRPNIDAIVQLLDQILPSIVAVNPDVKLTIVGRKPPRWLSERIASEHAVTLHNDVPDVRPYLQRAGALVVPLRIGGGSRLKILEALASGCPVISTAVGAEGLELEQDVDYVAVDDFDRFAEITLAAIADYERLSGTAEAGRSAVCEQYGWDRLAERLGAVWEAQCAKKGSTPQQARNHR